MSRVLEYQTSPTTSAGVTPPAAAACCDHKEPLQADEDLWRMDDADASQADNRADIL